MIDLGINLFQEIAALGGGGGYPIVNSLRFNDDDSAYLSRTPSVAGNRKTFTFSAWVKRGNINSFFELFRARTGSTVPYGILRINDSTNGDQITYRARSVSNVVIADVKTNAALRDASGWYHIVFVLDSTQAVASNRIMMYVNGVAQSLTTTTAVALNSEGGINGVYTHNIGVANRVDGYMAEINFIDGQALTADDFGEIDSVTGEWSPKAYSGTYGTNGFYLAFEDGSALGDDTSGNANDWTPTNLASTDQMLDTPTNNFSTLNPLTTTMTLSEGNLKETTNVTNNWQSAINTLGVSSGKWYFETCAPQALNSPPYAAIGITTNPNFGTKSGNNYLGNSADSWGYISDGDKYTSAIGTSYGTTYTNGDVIGCALDMDAGTITFYKNNVSQGVAYTGLTGTMFCGACSYAASGTTSNNINFGQDSSFAGLKTRQGNTDSNGKGDFYYTPPAGFLALCEDNLDALPFSASGGTETTITDGGVDYKVHTFTSSDTLYVQGVGEVEYLIVAGGAGGASAAVYDEAAGGGGAGGLIDSSGTVSTGSYPVVVGAGGASVSGYNTGGLGTDSTFNSETAIRGGAGGRGGGGGNGGSGGGAGGDSGTRIGGSGTAGQGNNGGNSLYQYYGGGGGGGAGAAGSNVTTVAGAKGGDGINWKSLGTYYAGGGGGSSSVQYGNPPGGAGGLGGGGAGYTNGAATSGSVNTGGGGGGSGTGPSGAGGSGIVIIRYAI